MEIKGRVAIVTGASSGIGEALARSLAAKGAKVALAARSRDKLDALAKELPGALAVEADLRKAEAASLIVDETMRKFGRIDILINNAGQGMRSSVEEIDLDEYRSILELNIFGVVRMMQAVIPKMRKAGGGFILNVSSRVSKKYFPNLAAYASTKYALNALSLTARTELAPDKIVVSVFHPKMTATEFGANALGEKYDSAAGRPGMEVDTAAAVAEKIIEQIESETPEASM